MGDRVLVRLFDRDDQSPILYLHWGAESLPSLLASFFESDPFTSNNGDVPCIFARLVAHACGGCKYRMTVAVMGHPKPVAEWIGSRDNSHGDGGMVAVDCTTGEIAAAHGYLADPKHWEAMRVRLNGAGFIAP